MTSNQPRDPLVQASNDTQQPQPALPSSLTDRQVRSDTPPQQAATQPDSGHAVHGAAGPSSNLTSNQGTDSAQQGAGPALVQEVPGTKVPFKDQVIGYAQKTRGTLLNKPELKEHGEQVLEGRTPAVKPGADV